MPKMKISGRNLDLIWNYINPKMLYNRHLGLRKKDKFDIVDNAVREAKTLARTFMNIYMEWKFFDADTIKKNFDFPENKETKQSITRYIGEDEVCLFVVSAGEGVRDISSKLKENGEYVKSITLQALAIETAEAAAEYLHQQIRTGWGYPDPLNMTMMERFQAKYLGCRYSFGYPACPDLEMQAVLFKLLEPNPNHFALTDGYMMDPEASVSAVAVKNPEAKYFGVGKDEKENEND